MSAWVAICGPVVCSVVAGFGRADERVTEHYGVRRVDAASAPGTPAEPLPLYDTAPRSGYSHPEYTTAAASTFSTTWPARRGRHLKGREPFRKFFK